MTPETHLIIAIICLALSAFVMGVGVGLIKYDDKALNRHIDRRIRISKALDKFCEEVEKQHESDK